MHFFTCNIENILKLKNVIASLYQTDYICTRKKSKENKIAGEIAQLVRAHDS